MSLPSKLLAGPIDCECGRKHTVPIDTISVTQDILQQVTHFLSRNQWRRLVVVADEQTALVQGDSLVNHLLSSHLAVHSVVFPVHPHLLPDEDAVQRVRDALHVFHPDAVVAVGSGVINDTVRYASFEAGLPYMVVATAPSMDGYASTIAAMQFRGLKITTPAQAPRAVFADPEILRSAPWDLLQSGVGDLLGKLIALMDWKLAHVLYGEYFCAFSYELVAESLRYCIEHADDIRDRDPGAIEALFMGLIHSGIAMSYVGNSRPASGAEHHCSHYWDWLAYLGRREHASHGIQVGYATHWMRGLYGKLSDLGEIIEPKLPQFDADWESDVRSRYGSAADDVVKEQRSKAAWLVEHAMYWPQNAPEAAALVAQLEPEFGMLQSVDHVLRTMEIPVEPGFLQITEDVLRETGRHARELRARYTLFDFLVGQGISVELI